MSDRMEVTVLGRNLGTASGWDQCDDFAVQFYDFVPADGVPLKPANWLYVDFDGGKLTADDEPIGDIVETFKSIPIAPVETMLP